MPVDGHGPSDIRSAWEEIAPHVREPTQLTIFGGDNLCLRGLKPSTKDTDVVVQGRQPIQPFLSELQAAGYETAEQQELIVFDGWVLVEKPGGIRIDLFPPHRIFDGPGLSHEMQQRREPWLHRGHLRAYLADPETVFLLKAITGRWEDGTLRDLEDLATILDRHPLDWGFIRSQWGAFTPRPHVRERARAAMQWLQAERYAVDWDP